MKNEELQIVIVDDEPLALNRIEQLLKNHDGLQVIGSYKDPLKAVSDINKNKPDLIFLDIQMPEITGFQLIEKLNKPWPIIIFTTAYDEYAFEAFQVHALDYLLKPIDEELFFEAIERVYEATQKNENLQISTTIESLLEYVENKASGKTYRTKIPIKRSDKIYFIEDDEILWVQASGKYVDVKQHDKTHTLRSLLSDFGDTLDPAKFIRIHRSVIININHIKEINHWFRGEYQVVMIDGEKFTTGKTYRDSLKQLID